MRSELVAKLLLHWNYVPHRYAQVHIQHGLISAKRPEQLDPLVGAHLFSITLIPSIMLYEFTSGII